MLKQRILTAFVLLIVFGAALYLPTPIPFMALTLLLIGAAGWEWARLAGRQGWKALGSGVYCAALALLLWWWVSSGWYESSNQGDGALILGIFIVIWFGYGALFLYIGLLLGWYFWMGHWPDNSYKELLLWCFASLYWISGGGMLLSRGVAQRKRLTNSDLFVGYGALVVAWLALVQAYTHGINFLLSTLALVWAADIAAYFVGRALGGKLTGGRKLAPTISPGKSWEGAVGGFIGVLLTGAIWIWVDRAYALPPGLYTIFWQRGPVWFVGALALLTAMSVVGDLVESLVKRSAGVKDSSRLLPGHGGVLDRIDALLPTLPLALLLVTIGQELK
ncbi:MAG: phosphatidate cytidylyltransferase [Burkholderiaceae bacterium]|jgi:phosphatidate cytidylyltransferase|nr:phosphatidate cytidylyltransferase [Burkholderiaceae bacterium]